MLTVFFSRQGCRKRAQSEFPCFCAKALRFRRFQKQISGYRGPTITTTATTNNKKNNNSNCNNIYLNAIKLQLS